MSDSDLVPPGTAGYNQRVREKKEAMEKEKKINDARKAGREHREANEAGTGTSSGKMTDERKKRYEGKADKPENNMSPEEKKAYREGYSEG
ncbi:MAG: hypothetical protein GW808_02675 [Sphingomonadales bacterium]|nr:hypothetical protein [Sphingomonadales bacterium]PIX66669.1 MAG: hypothetical protein COZ43_05230 [Sphingomonadales bacterium CG_4_10_14_3_um_filter_58_15]NCO48488.1 hypothetical protein [Sphingomonadales bacterium]NCO99304.1 hypothetical protein [Sphingomonadales bacterium]NCP27863.1 hypothetical protein [Sphingomonadales bacterium]